MGHLYHGYVSHNQRVFIFIHRVYSIMCSTSRTSIKFSDLHTIILSLSS